MKIIKLSESDLKNIVKKIIFEQERAKKYNILVKKEKTEISEPQKTDDKKTEKSKIDEVAKCDRKVKPGEFDVYFVGGLDNRGYKNLSEQTNLLKTNLGNKRVIAKSSVSCGEEDILNTIKSDPNMYVVLFSNGCKYSYKIANIIRNKNKLFIVEPHSSSTEKVRSAVNSGVPSKNVVVGTGKGTGQGMIEDPTKTPYGDKELGLTNKYGKHWGALPFVGTLIK